MNRPTLRAIARLLAPWRTIRRLEAQNELFSDALANPTLTGIAIHQNEATVGGAGPGPQLLAGMFLGLLQDNPKAVNYLQMTFGSPEGNILVTVHRPGGATPHNLRAMAEQEARNLRAELATAQEALQRLKRWGGWAGEGFGAAVGRKGFDAAVSHDVITWIDAGMAGQLPLLPEWLAKRETKDDPGDHH